MAGFDRNGAGKIPSSTYNRDNEFCNFTHPHHLIKTYDEKKNDCFVCSRFPGWPACKGTGKRYPALPQYCLTAPAGDKVTEGKKAVFSIKPLGKAYDKYDVTYNWMVSNGTITGGQGTVAIQVDTKGLKNESITVTVEVGGLRYNCSNIKSASIDVVGKN